MEIGTIIGLGCAYLFFVAILVIHFAKWSIMRKGIYLLGGMVLSFFFLIPSPYLFILFLLIFSAFSIHLYLVGYLVIFIVSSFILAPYARWSFALLSLIYTLLCFRRRLILVTFLVVIVGVSSQAEATAILKYDTIIVTGTSNTLSSIASDISDEAVFDYDEKMRTAVCTANLEIQGALIIGSQTLEMNTVECGEYKIIVEEGGSLEIYDSTMATKRRRLLRTGCTQGYSLMIKGGITVINSTISYMDRIEFKDDARIKLINAEFPHGCNKGFLNIDGANAKIKNCKFYNIGDWGLAVRNKRGKPLLIEDSLLRGEVGDILNSGYNAEVILLDCDFDKANIAFSQLTGKVVVRWRLKVKVKVIGKGDDMAQGLIVTAVSSNASNPKEKITASINKKGVAFLELTEFIATPLVKRRTDGKNNLTPHDIMVYSQDRTLLAKKRVDLHKKGQEVILYVGLKGENKD